MGLKRLYVLKRSREGPEELPHGSRRFVQGASGYVATLVAGEVVRRNGADTGAHPGRLVRAGR
jgi:N-acyl-D-aspartate/D-glutamate deacylase